jgi:hypothetical protein
VIEIHENYKAFKQPPWLRLTVERLLMSLEPEHIGGLKSVVLTDSASIGRGKTRRVAGRKYDRNACRGFYHHEWNGKPAWIQLVADNFIAGYPPFVLRFQLLRDLIVADILYHEVGHHLQARVGSTGRGGEGAAEYWRKRLLKIHAQRHYKYLPSVQFVFKRLLRLWLRIGQPGIG